VFGGSLGASSINNAVLKLLSRLIGNEIQVIWQTGEIDYDRVKAESDQMMERSGGTIIVHKFIERMEQAYAACDLAVCRAGATTVAELTKAGVASILVPYPYAAANHQTENAKAMVESGAAMMIGDAELGSELLTAIEKLLTDPTRLRLMRTNAFGVGNPEATGVLARAVVNLARAEHARA
jgi:UDP-N-acetylglucosamine--N-acetylmuramyl-(pentapeptide) pyrophosphoryl-undecaprenol N-acetylglucosamine transferase